MFITIDLERMVVVHKTDDHTTASYLASIELPHVPTLVSAHHLVGYWKFTDLELRKLYKGITGADFIGYGRPQLAAAVVTLIERMPFTDCAKFEVYQQYQSISQKDDARYRYVKGSSKPAPVDDDYTIEAICTAPLTIEEAAKLKAVQAPEPAKGNPHPGATAPQHTPAAPTPAPQQRSRPVAPTSAAPAAPRGGQRTVIWDAADAAWEKAGKPTDVKAVLTLRKAIMDDLENQGVKRTSCSSELGNWQKARIPG